MSNTSTASDSLRPLRRSTRINKSVPITVMGVDSYRGPYREDVSTVAVSCHGCRYESKHDVLTNSWVMLELPGLETNGEPLSARGLVKWVRRPTDTNGVYETAIELEDPGNIWGVDTPPEDWVTFCQSRLNHEPAKKSKPFAVQKPAPLPKTPVGERSATSTSPSAAPLGKQASPVSHDRPMGMGLFVGEFQQQIEKMLFEAAEAAVREKAVATLDEVREGLRDEAKRVLAEVASSQTGPWIEQSLKQLNKVTQESAKTLHAAWARRLDADTRRAIERVEERGRELDTLAQSLSANALDRLQRGLESSRGEGVDRIVARLKEQSAPVIDHAKETIAELAKQREEFQTTIEQSLARSTARIEEACTGFERQFEMIIRERIDAAHEELQNAIRSATASAIDDFSSSVQQQEMEAQSRLRSVLEPIAEAALKDIKDRAGASSHDFLREMSDRSRAHLEFVSSSIAELAKGIGKLPNE